MPRRSVSLPWVLLPQPTPGAREIRFRPPRSHADNRPKEEKTHV